MGKDRKSTEEIMNKEALYMAKNSRDCNFIVSEFQ